MFKTKKKKIIVENDNDFCQYVVDRRVDDEKKTVIYIIKNTIHCVRINAAIESMAIISLYWVFSKPVEKAGF